MAVKNTVPSDFLFAFSQLLRAFLIAALPVVVISCDSNEVSERLFSLQKIK